MSEYLLPLLIRAGSRPTSEAQLDWNSVAHRAPVTTQVVPTRGNTDAINVHPFEFIPGEYNHLLTVYLISRYLVNIHAVTCILFLVLGGTLATLNVSYGLAPDACV